MVFDSELQQQRTLPAADMGNVFDVAEISNGEFIIAATKGLYHRSNGKLHKLMPGFSSNVIVCGVKIRKRILHTCSCR